MIRLYIASKKLTEQDKDICVRLTLPAEENEIWMAMQKAEMESVDDCELSEVCCDYQEADNFLNGLEIWDVDIFTLNQYAKLLESMTETERVNHHTLLAEKNPKSLKEVLFQDV